LCEELKSKPFFIFLFAIFISLSPLHAKNILKEIIVRTGQNIRHTEDIDRLITLCRKYRIDTVTLLCKQDEDDRFLSGTLFYPSAYAKVAKGYEKEDLLARFIAKAHQNGIKVKAWIPQFQDHIAANKHPLWRMIACEKNTCKPYNKEGAHFLNPLHPQVQQYELNIIKEIAERYDFDAIVLDWIRFDDYAMDLSKHTRKRFQKRYGFDPLTIDFHTENAKRRLWEEFRNEAIAAYIHRVKESLTKIKPRLPLGVFVLSPAWKELSQQPSFFRFDIDFIQPMCYYDDWGYPLNWIYDPKRDDAIIPSIKKAVTKNVRIIPTFDADWESDVYTTLYAKLSPIKHFAFFLYGQWTKESFEKVLLNSL